MLMILMAVLIIFDPGTVKEKITYNRQRQGRDWSEIMTVLTGSVGQTDKDEHLILSIYLLYNVRTHLDHSKVF